MSVVFLAGLLVACGDEQASELFGVDESAVSVAAKEWSPVKPVWAIPSEEDRITSDPMRIVNAQHDAMDEFDTLTTEAVKSRPPECDTEKRPEVEGEMIPLTIYLPEQPFDFRRYRNAIDPKDRLALTQERQGQLRESQSAVAKEVEALGGLITNYEYILNALDADIPICELHKVANLSGIIGIEVESSEPVPQAVDGIQRRNAFGLPNAGHSIFTGAFGSTRNSQNAVRFGVIESRSKSSNNLNTSHLSFNGSGGFTRIVDTDKCDSWPPFGVRRCIHSATGTSSTHGTQVTSVLLSDFSRGQSTAITGNARYQRSGIAPRATVHYYVAKKWPNFRVAVREAALKDGTDIINMSFNSNSSSDWCSSPTLNGMRQALEAAVDAGVVTVASAANYGEDGNCTVSPPATYTSTISVGGTRHAASLTDLENVTRASKSSYGAITHTISGGRMVDSSLITVVANYSHRLAAGSGQTGIVNISGTSFAAPSIAGIVALIKHWIWYRGGLPQGMSNDPVAIRAILSLMGDGRTAGSDALVRRDPEFGYGNVRFVNLDSDTGTEGSWGIKKISVSHGSMAEWKIGGSGATSDQLKGFKAVAIADRYNRGTSPDILFELVDKCSSNAPTSLLTADRSALEWRLRVVNVLSRFFLHDRCLWLRVTAQSATGSTNLYVAWVLYSNDRIHHDASNL